MDSLSENSVMSTECEKQVNESQLQRPGVKRPRENSISIEDSEENNADDGFITVRRKNKHPAKNLLDDNQNNGCEDKIEVCITSKNILPKQFGMAKLLRSENIEGVNKIKNKGPYKIIIEFDEESEAKKLLNCKRFNDTDIICQKINERNISYGIVKQVDLDINEEELLNTLQSEYEIFSILRLNRLTDEKKWIPSETIRVGFRTSTLPPYIYGYGCRFKVESYTFSVSQCSICWKFGHLRKSCSTKVSLCPKCGGPHESCETIDFKCINCKGPHMSLDKSCPVFIKEKEIRNIMCQDQLTYRKALETYLTNNNMKNPLVTQEVLDKPLTSGMERSYRDVLVTESTAVESESSSDEMQTNADKSTCKNKPKKQNKKKKSKQNKFNLIAEEVNITHKSFEEGRKPTTSSTQSKNKEKKKSFDFQVFKQNLLNIIVADISLNEKIELLIKNLYEGAKYFLLALFKNTDITKKIFNFFVNG